MCFVRQLQRSTCSNVTVVVFAAVVVLAVTVVAAETVPVVTVVVTVAVVAHLSVQSVVAVVVGRQQFVVEFEISVVAVVSFVWRTMAHWMMQAAATESTQPVCSQNLQSK